MFSRPHVFRCIREGNIVRTVSGTMMSILAKKRVRVPLGKGYTVTHCQQYHGNQICFNAVLFTPPDVDIASTGYLDRPLVRTGYQCLHFSLTHLHCACSDGIRVDDDGDWRAEDVFRAVHLPSGVRPSEVGVLPSSRLAGQVEREVH